MSRPILLPRRPFDRKKERKKERKKVVVVVVARPHELRAFLSSPRVWIARAVLSVSHRSCIHHGTRDARRHDHRFKFQNTNATTRDDERRREGKEKKKEKKKEEHRARAYRLFPALERRTRRRRWWCCCSWGSSCSRVRFKILAERLLDAFVRENAFSFETKHHTHVIRARL